MRPSSGDSHRKLLGALACLSALACAAPMQPTPAPRSTVEVRRPSVDASPPPPQPASVDATRVAEALLAALRAGDVAAAHRTFDDTMSARLPRERLDSVWRGLQDGMGALREWKLRNRAVVD